MWSRFVVLVALGLAIAPALEARGIKVDTRKDLLEFSYSWPKRVADVPALDRWLRANKEYQKRHFSNLARREYNEDNYGFTTYFYRQKWRVVADTRSLLILSADVHMNLGGAHGTDFPATIIWDKAKKASSIDCHAARSDGACQCCPSEVLQRTRRRAGKAWDTDIH